MREIAIKAQQRTLNAATNIALGNVATVDMYRRPKAEGPTTCELIAPSIPSAPNNFPASFPPFGMRNKARLCIAGLNPDPKELMDEATKKVQLWFERKMHA